MEERKSPAKLQSPVQKTTRTQSALATPLKLPSIQKEEPQQFSYFTYNQLVGEADGGKQLKAEEFQQILQKYHDSWQNRTYVHFARKDGTKQCLRVKPQCFCFCEHTFKSHEWWDSENQQVRCRVPGCRCDHFRYLHHQGSWYLNCQCQHSAVEHNDRGLPGFCIHKGCDCNGFETTFACQCGVSWNEHKTMVDTEEQRRAMGKPVDTDVVKQRLVHQKVEGCGKCLGCKNRMPCYFGFKK